MLLSCGSHDSSPPWPRNVIGVLPTYIYLPTRVDAMPLHILRLLLFFVILLLATPQPAATQPRSDWVSLSAAQKLADEQGAIVLVLAEADWCGYCRRLKEEVFVQEDVGTLLKEHFALVSIDVEGSGKIVYQGRAYTERSFAQQMRVAATPTLIFIGAGGRVLGRQAGFIEADQFVALLEYLLCGAYDDMSFKEYLRDQRG